MAVNEPSRNAQSDEAASTGADQKKTPSFAQWIALTAALAALLGGAVTETAKYFLNRNAKPPAVHTDVISQQSIAPTVNPSHPEAPTKKTTVSRVKGNNNVTGNTVTQGPGSIAQLGGTGNTAIITVPVSRVLSDEKLAAFTTELKKSETSGVLRVVLASSADDVFPLSQQLCAAADLAHWAIACPPTRNSSMGREMVAEGLQCYSDDWQTSDVMAFTKAMKAAGLTCGVHPRHYDFGPMVIGGTDGVTVVIGSPTAR